MRRRKALAFLPVLVALSFAGQGTPLPKHTCLAFISTELAKGTGNFFTYYHFSDLSLTIKPGDTLVYSVMLDPKNPSPKGGVDISFDDGDAELRDQGAVDQNGIKAHGDGLLEPAMGHWYTRKIPLDVVKGRTTRYWNLQFEGDLPGRYVQFLDDVYVLHADGTRTDVYSGGVPKIQELESHNGYSEYPSVIPVDRSLVSDGANLDPVILIAERQSKKLASLEEARKSINLTRKFLEKSPDPAAAAHVQEAQALLDHVEAKDSTEDEVKAALLAARHALSHTHPMMEQYAGHLVGHAHIDLQWLWDWQEGIVATHDTFNQAVKFMDEFPGFTFSQSSSCLYQTVEQDYPELFAKIQQKVKTGQWEIMGGRVCEGDTNMISPESHARHFLYGQRYFREKFGKIARVGWEPDTFGHTIQMPQILKLGGCDNYYFCRGGKGKPLFWWKGLDGTKVLAFDEPASGSWYNSDLTYHQFQEMLDFQDKTGSKDMLWVYGVGNHGGGPTREYIQTALGWMNDPTKPKVKFSTATQFFDKLRTYNLAKIPVVDQELNGVFQGCYTTHSEVKQLNRQAEYATTSAEAVATAASTFGFAYPKDQFRKAWEDICFNHHHDTLPGSGIHSPYERTKITLGRVLADDKDTMTRAMETMTIRVTPEKGGISVMVFNPNGWSRSAWVNTFLVASGWSDNGFDPNKAIATSPDGKNSEVVLLDKVSRLAKFFAADVPAFGYRVFHLHEGAAADLEAMRTNSVLGESGENSLENGTLQVKLDPKTGTIASLIDKRTHRELAGAGGLGRLEMDYDGPNGSTAWDIGPIKRTEVLHPTSTSGNSFTYEVPAYNNPGATTTVRQSFSLDGDKIVVSVDCNWQQIATPQTTGVVLRAAFESALHAPTATYEVPFGALSRPTDGAEVPGLNWGDISDADGGLSVLNDSKSGMSAKDSTYKLTLIRSSFTPDPNPNPGHYHWTYVILPHTGGLDTAATAKRGMELQQPLLAASVPFDGRGGAPLQWSLLNVSDSNTVVTGLKRGEEKGDLIVRSYDASTRPATGSLQIFLPAADASYVNFIEDELGKATIQGGRVPLAMRPWEIRTVKVKIANAKY